MSNNNRKKIGNHVKYKLYKERMHNLEKYLIYITIVFFFIIIIRFYNSFLDFNVYFYGIDDIQTLNINTDTLKYLSNTYNKNNTSFEKMFTMYAKKNNYFSENSYVEDISKIADLTYFQSINFFFFNLNKENKAVYNIIKNINTETQALPIASSEFKKVSAINNFNTSKEIFTTIFIQKEVSTNEALIQSVSNGIVKNIKYNNENGLEITIYNEKGIEYIYGNLSYVNVDINQNIKTYDVLGTMGNTLQINDKVNFKRSRLSLSIRYNSDYFGNGFYINPYPFLYLQSLEI